MYLNFRSVGDMSKAILSNLYRIPHDIDLVVGIPRSGMLPANLIALYLNKPFTDIDSFAQGRIYASGERGAFIDKGKSQKVLVVDDSINSGGSLNKAKNKLHDFTISHSNIKLLFGAVYATTASKNLVDIYCEILDGLRIFEWNLFHHPVIIPQSIFDIDGVLCPNPPIDDDGDKYLAYISNAPILYKPTIKIDKLVSCRLEKYRKVTEKWLAKNDINYNELIMLPFNTKEERVKWGRHGYYKGEVYQKSDDLLFVESSLQEAKQIFSVCKKPVFCTENFEMINDESFKNTRLPEIKVKLSKTLPYRILRKIWNVVK